MGSVVFDKLWVEAYEREGELAAHAGVLARIYSITSAVAAIRLARLLQEAGRPFFEHCAAAYKAEQERIMHRLKRQGRMSEHDMKLVKQLIAKSTEKW